MLVVEFVFRTCPKNASFNLMISFEFNYCRRNKDTCSSKKKKSIFQIFLFVFVSAFSFICFSYFHFFSFFLFPFFKNIINTLSLSLVLFYFLFILKSLRFIIVLSGTICFQAISWKLFSNTLILYLMLFTKFGQKWWIPNSAQAFINLNVFLG